MNNRATKKKQQVSLLSKAILIPVTLVTVVVLIISITQSEKTVEPSIKVESNSVSAVKKEVSPRISSMFNCRDKKRSIHCEKH